MIPFANPRVQYLSHKEEIDAAITRVLQSGRYILGEEVREFETVFSRYIGVSHCVGVGSGTEAIRLALAACGVGKGDEVLTVSHTAVATVAAIEQSGAEPVLVDIEPDFYTMDPDKIEAAITSKTKAILPVHIYGQPAEMASILSISEQYGLKIIEDCAQAHGAVYNGKRVGAIGDVACFSFYPTKNLGAIGDGGAVVTDSETIAGRIRLLREYGWKKRFVSEIKGGNSRLDELQAAVLRVKLTHLEDENRFRSQIAELYQRKLADCGLQLPRTRKNATHVYHLFVVESQDRDRFLEFLTANSIGAAVHYPVPVHRQPAYQRLNAHLPVTESAARRICSLPIYPGLNAEQVDYITETIALFCATHSPIRMGRNWNE